MVQAQASTLIRRPTDQVFEFVADNFHRNYRHWSPEVVEFEVLSDGPIRPGWIARQVRVDKGRRTSARFRVSHYQAGERLAFQGIDKPFFVEYRFAPIHVHTRVEFRFELQRLDLMWRPFERVIRMAVRDGAESLVRNLKQVVEAEIAATPDERQAAARPPIV
ncbi:SRPBCC family protein [Thioalkalicoccus limnaeus]|uniref:SRPBCC family protein n=1 Tax=Thioalkalicoccus limnaeus TaxID=120681 RepID=A0ABV4BBF1_9GAMM